MFSELWVDGPDAEGYAARFGGWLSGALQSFVRDGFIIIPDAVPQAAIDTVFAEFSQLKADPADALVATAAGYSLLRDFDTQEAGSRILDTFLFAPSALDLMFATTRIAEFLRALFDDEILAFQSLHFEEVGSTQGIHQDTAYVVVDTPLQPPGLRWRTSKKARASWSTIRAAIALHRIYGGRKHWEAGIDGGAEPHERHLRSLRERAQSYGIERRAFPARKRRRADLARRSRPRRRQDHQARRPGRQASCRPLLPASQHAALFRGHTSCGQDAGRPARGFVSLL